MTSVVVWRLEVNMPLLDALSFAFTHRGALYTGNQAILDLDNQMKNLHGIKDTKIYKNTTHAIKALPTLVHVNIALVAQNNGKKGVNSAHVSAVSADASEFVVSNISQYIVEPKWPTCFVVPLKDLEYFNLLIPANSSPDLYLENYASFLSARVVPPLVELQSILAPCISNIVIENATKNKNNNMVKLQTIETLVVDEHNTAMVMLESIAEHIEQAVADVNFLVPCNHWTSEALINDVTQNNKKWEQAIRYLGKNCVSLNCCNDVDIEDKLFKSCFTEKKRVALTLCSRHAPIVCLYTYTEIVRFTFTGDELPVYIILQKGRSAGCKCTSNEEEY